MKKEQTAYIISIFAGLFMAVLGFVFSHITNSQSIYMDGMFSLVNMSMASITFILSRKVVSYKSDRFQYGIGQAEPMINVIKAIIFLGVLIFALFLAIMAIWDGGRPMNFDSGILYALIAAVGCFLTAFLIKLVEKHNNSPMLAVERKGWFVDGILSSAVLLVFGAGYLIRNTELAKYSDYIDPGMMILLILLVLPIPIKIFKDNFFDLLFSAPPKVTIEIIEKHIDAEIPKSNIEDYFWRTAKLGRFHDVHISLLLKVGKDLGADALDEIRTRLHTSINSEVPNAIITLETTMNPQIFNHINEQ